MIKDKKRLALKLFIASSIIAIELESNPINALKPASKKLDVKIINSCWQKVSKKHIKNVKNSKSKSFKKIFKKYFKKVLTSKENSVKIMTVHKSCERSKVHWKVNNKYPLRDQAVVINYQIKFFKKWAKSSNSILIYIYKI